MEDSIPMGESKEKRLNRFQNGSPIEIIETLLNSINNYFNNELRVTFSNPTRTQPALMILGVHSVALTISYGLFNKQREAGYRMYFEHFVDGDTPDTKFSTIAAEIHEWRNVIAHRWLNVAGHDIGYDLNMLEGWKKEGNSLLINPKIYLDHFLSAFENGGRIYRYEQILTTDQMLEDAKQRLISKYLDEA